MKVCPRCHVILDSIRESLKEHMRLHIEADLSQAAWNAHRDQDEYGIRRVEFTHSNRYRINDI